MRNAPILFVISVGTLVVFFQNCTKMDFEKVSPSVGQLSVEDVQQVLERCSDAEAQGQLSVSEQQIKFEDTHQETGRSQVCEFGVGDNLSQKNDFMRARYEQKRKLNIPANAVVCDIEISTRLQRFRYDDVFFLTFNDRVLATNNKSALKQRIEPESQIVMSDASRIPLYKYDWLKLRDGSFNNQADDYCLGMEQNKSNCTWPITEQLGNIKFEFEPELLVNLGLLDSSQNSQFGFVVTGDNDPNVDCGHETLEFTMKVKYYLK